MLPVLVKNVRTSFNYEMTSEYGNSLRYETGSRKGAFNQVIYQESYYI